MKKSWWIGVSFGIVTIAIIAIMMNPSTKSLFQSKFGIVSKNPPAESSESRNVPVIDKPEMGVIPANLASSSPKSSLKPTTTTTSKPSATTSPTSTPKASVSSTSTPTATPKPTPTPTPTPVPDTQPPVFEYVTGPASEKDGETVTFNSFCFPMRLTDNFPGTISVRYSFDNSGPSEWGQNYAPCYQNVSNGFHVFVVQGRDAAGNETGHISRNFNVSVSN